jgi:hypothetical protein
MVRVGGELALAIGPLFVYYTAMAKSSGVLQKVKRFSIAKAAEGDTPMMSLRLPAETREALDKWAAAQEDRPGRSEAIRRLLNRALALPHIDAQVAANRKVNAAKPRRPAKR